MNTCIARIPLPADLGLVQRETGHHPGPRLCAGSAGPKANVASSILSGHFAESCQIPVKLKPHPTEMHFSGSEGGLAINAQCVQ